MQLSMTPFLLAIQLGFLLVLARRSERLAPADGSMAPVHLFVLWIAAYGVVTSVLGAQGFYISEEMLRLYPAFWLQVVTVAVAVVPVVLFAGLRDGLRRIVDSTPLHWFAGFHALRITALGTAAKTLQGEFPLYFEVLVGLPDLLFGLSALWVAARLKQARLGKRGFLWWNLIGALIIVPSAPILIQLGLPGPLQVFNGLPDARAVLAYPMSIAPMIVVPLFVLANLLLVWRLWERAGPVKT
ncbi:hypothetical protein [Pelagibius sp.]|uniref:hypothetical protein n=1 Tax=Pelagibius sp. TaxID=1931238 RepID=UPI002619EEE9|nr:hypothetical protein [Pelagibius sp.]